MLGENERLQTGKSQGYCPCSWHVLSRCHHLCGVDDRWPITEFGNERLRSLRTKIKKKRKNNKHTNWSCLTSVYSISLTSCDLHSWSQVWNSSAVSHPLCCCPKLHGNPGRVSNGYYAFPKGKPWFGRELLIQYIRS